MKKAIKFYNSLKKTETYKIKQNNINNIKSNYNENKILKKEKRKRMKTI